MKSIFVVFAFFACALMSSGVSAQSQGGIPVIRTDPTLGPMCAGPTGPAPCAEVAQQVRETGPCAGHVGCLQATISDPFTPPQSRTECTGMDWNFSWCKHKGCPRNCTAHSTEWRHMENTFIAYVEVPPNWNQTTRARIDGAARQCWAEGYRAAGYSTLAAIIIAAASQGTTASAIPGFVINQTQEAIANCLEREGAQLGIDLASNLAPRISQVSGGWTEWQ